MAGQRSQPYGRSLWNTSWGTELRQQLRVVRDVPTRGPEVHLTAFDRLDSRLAQRNLSRDEVLYDLRQGIFNVSRMDDDGRDRRDRPSYRMITQRLELRLHVEPSHPQYVSSGRMPLSVLDTAFPRRKEARSDLQTPLVPADVTLSDPWQRMLYDLDELVEEVRKRRWLAEAERSLTRVRLTPRRHSELRAEVRRQYGSLRALLALVQQRAEVGDKTSCPGTVVQGREAFPPDHPLAEELVVRLDRTTPFPPEEGTQLAIWFEGDSERRPTSLPLGDSGDDVVALLLPKQADRATRMRRRFTPGRRVVVSETGEFRYSRHLYALRKFLDEEDVVGNWTSLATLLCQPGNLAEPSHVDEIVPHRRPLNAEQRRAVAGALASSHGFFVKGPPGTGKTQVITETVSRLAARGERVLLTAPTHVAVDEVLRRLADEPGVLPLRLSYKDNLVADDVKRFTQTGYESMLAQDVRTPATSKLPEWQARLDALNEERGALTTWHALVADRASADQALAAARSTATDRDRQRSGQRAQLAGRLEQARSQAAAWGAEVGRLQSEDQALATRIAAMWPTRGGLGRLLDRLGLGAVGRLEATRRRVQQRLVQANTAYHQAGQRFEVARRYHDQAGAALGEQQRHDHAQVAELEQRSAQASARIDPALERLRRAGLEHLAHDQPGATSRLVELDTEASNLAALVEVQQRWFELLGLTGHDEADDRERSRTVVGRALASAVNLVCSTTTGFGGAPDHRDLDYDTLIVDEASKVTGAEFLIPARRARRWILVGDEKQLPPYVEPTDEHHLHALAAIHLAERQGTTVDDAVRQLADIWERHEDTELHAFRTKNVEDIGQRLLDNGTWASAHRALYSDQIRHVKGSGETPEHQLLEAMYQHLVNSLFQRCVTATTSGLVCRLEEQRRMPAQIAELVRMPVYGGAYRSPGPNADGRVPQPLTTPSFRTPVVFLDTSAQPKPWDKLDRTSFVNNLEAEWVAEVCRLWEEELPSVGVTARTTISVLSFYGAQTRLIRQKLGYPHYRKRFALLDFQVVDAIDRIQGQESDIVVISFCRTNQSHPDKPLKDGYARWLQSINRLNVGCTRARRALVLVGHRSTLRRLNGVPTAEDFYANMFGLGQADGVTVRSDWAPRNRKGRR